MSWTVEREETLKTLWRDGFSCSQIAARLGGMTRNAVIGKVHRLGLNLNSERTKPRPGPAPRVRQKRERSQVCFKRPEPPTNPEPIEPIDDCIIPVGQRRTLMELTSATCRWPIGHPGTPEFFFCGGTPREGGPYCSYHHFVAHPPPGRRA